MTNTEWWNYVADLIGEDSFSTAADKAGFDKSAFTRWKRGAAADPFFAVKLARAYKSDVLTALVKAGLISESEAGDRPAPLMDLNLVSDDQLLKQIEQRMQEGRPSSNSSNELAARRKARSNAAESNVRGDDYDDEALIDRINAGLEPIAAQKRTDPLDENYT